MKNILLFLGFVLLLSGCKNEVMQPPQKLIEEDKMVDIIYDLALLEAMRSQPQDLDGKMKTIINPKTYIYKKYSIDSLQFAESNHYYASDIGNYKKMYDKVKQRIEQQQKQADALAKKSMAAEPIAPAKPNANAPQVK